MQLRWVVEPLVLNFIRGIRDKDKGCENDLFIHIISHPDVLAPLDKWEKYSCVCAYLFFAERITQSIVKSHLETCQYSAEDMKRFTWVQYTPDETRAYQSKVHNTHPKSEKSF